MADSWDSPNVVLRGGQKRVATVQKSETAINAAKRAGIAVDTSAKSRSLNTASAKGPADYQHKAALDADDAPKPPAKVDVSVGQAIAKARQEKKDSNGKAMSQKDLATAVNEKPTVIADYEAGRAVPNVALLAKIERQLGVKLRGDPKLIGTPLPKPGQKK